MDKIGEFTYFDDYFTIQLNSKLKFINWIEIELIKVYKVDQITIDCIVIEIYLPAKIITLNEDISGFYYFMEITSNKLVGFNRDWFRNVATPAFESNLSIIYQRII